MKRYYFLIIITFFILQGFSKQINPDDYVLFTIETLKETKVLSYGDIDTLYIYSNGLPFNISDTIMNSVRLIFISSKEDLFFRGVKFWFETIKFDLTTNNVVYGFCLNSWQELENFKYVSGLIVFKKTNGKWLFEKKKVKNIDYEKISNLDGPLVKQPPRQRRNYVECYNFKLKKIANREFNNLADTLIGNWFSIDDSKYSEYLFLNDSIYQYTDIMGKYIPARYDFENRDLIITPYNDKKFRLTIDKIDFNTIRLYGTDLGKFNNIEPETYNIDFTIHRISDREFNFSDIKCWKEIETKDGRIKCSRDQEKFIKGFKERQIKACE